MNKQTFLSAVRRQHPPKATLFMLGLILIISTTIAVVAVASKPGAPEAITAATPLASTPDQPQLINPNSFVGQRYRDIAMADPKGKTHKLSEYVGAHKYVLLDFWASWCPPCRADMPQVVELYQTYKGKKFEIVGISLDRDAAAWQKGITDLHMSWPQLSDLLFWDNAAARLYNVNSIPHTLLIDKKGIIVAEGLRGEELDACLAALLK